MNGDHVWHDTLIWQLLQRRKLLYTLILFRSLLDQAGLTINLALGLLLLDTSKLTHIYSLGYNIILLEHERRLLLLLLVLMLLDLLNSAIHVCVHLQTVHYLTKILLLHR